MDKSNAKEMTKLAILALEDKKAEDIRVIDISEVSIMADYFIIANGSNRSQIQALSDHVQETLGKAGYELRQAEGYNTANWILLDFGDLIVHIFDKENRLFYNLERIWRDGKIVDKEEL
ncbi:MAG: ribosome silencing factor [Lachnospiraceae bacterium]